MPFRESSSTPAALSPITRLNIRCNIGPNTWGIATFTKPSPMQPRSLVSGWSLAWTSTGLDRPFMTLIPTGLPGVPMARPTPMASTILPASTAIITAPMFPACFRKSSGSISRTDSPTIHGRASQPARSAIVTIVEANSSLIRVWNCLVRWIGTTLSIGSGSSGAWTAVWRTGIFSTPAREHTAEMTASGWVWSMPIRSPAISSMIYRQSVRGLR